MISGCSGSGKSSLLTELARRGYDVVPEARRQIVKEQMFIGGNALPWKDAQKFSDALLSRSMYLYNSARPRSDVVFFDRSIIEPLTSYAQSAEPPPFVRRAVDGHRYFSTVFMTLP